MPLPSFPSPHRHPPGSEFVVLKQMRVDGVDLGVGAHLPADSPIRDNPRRLEALCRLRRLAPVTETAGVSAGRAQTEVLKPLLVDLGSMDRAQLAELCQDRGVSSKGNAPTLRRRLRQVA